MTAGKTLTVPAARAALGDAIDRARGARANGLSETECIAREIAIIDATDALVSAVLAAAPDYQRAKAAAVCEARATAHRRQYDAAQSSGERRSTLDALIAAAKREAFEEAANEAAQEVRRPFTPDEIRRVELSVDPRFEPFLIIEDRIRALAAKVTP